MVVWLILPDLRRRVVRCAGLRIQQSFLSHFWYVQIAQLRGAVLTQEDIRTFEVSMEYFHLMQNFESFNHVDKNCPYRGLGHRCCLILMVNYPLIQITVICKLHDKTKGRAAILKEGFFVSDDVRVTKNLIKWRLLYGGKDSYLV